MGTSFTNKGTDFVAEEREIISSLASAIAAFPTGYIADAANAGVESVKAWRSERNAPQLAKAVRLARRVPKIKAAIYELIEAGDLNCQRSRLFKIMFDALLEITKSGDELAAHRAREALKEFSQLSEMANSSNRGGP